MSILKVLLFSFMLAPQPAMNYNIPTENKEEVEAYVPLNQYTEDLYDQLNDQELNKEAFTLALKGYSELYLKNKLKNTKYLTVVDMTQSSNTERMFIIDMQEHKIVYKNLVSHGMNTGQEFAKDFSNESNSHKSSLGFYTTGELYNGKHDLSMKLDGLEYSNDHARSRGVVVHSAEYVSKEFIQKNGRLGRSFGCPAIPEKNYESVVNKIKNGSCFFIYYPEKEYMKRSKIVNSTSDFLISQSGDVTMN